MFNIGGDDKEKLEENMEEIKEIVNEGNGQPENPADTEQEAGDLSGIQNSDLQGDLSSDDSINQDASENTFSSEQSSINGELGNQTSQNFDQSQNRSQQNPAPERGQAQTNQPPANNSPIQNNRVKGQHQQDNQSGNQRGRQREERRPARGERDNKQTQGEDSTDELEEIQDQLKNKISSLENQQTSSRLNEASEKEEKEEDLSEETLFLEVEKFEDIKNMVEEMHYLTTEMDDVMKHLENGIEEDQGTMDEAEEIVSEFQARRDKIETTLRDN